MHSDYSAGCETEDCINQQRENPVCLISAKCIRLPFGIAGSVCSVEEGAGLNGKQGSRVCRLRKRTGGARHEAQLMAATARGVLHARAYNRPHSLGSRQSRMHASRGSRVRRGVHQHALRSASARHIAAAVQHRFISIALQAAVRCSHIVVRWAAASSVAGDGSA
jgi:hypothetical protein